MILLEEYNIVCSHASISSICRGKNKKGGYYKDTEKVDMLPLKKGEVIVRMFPIEEDDSNKDKIGMGMICVSDSPNDIHVDYHDLFESIPK